MYLKCGERFTAKSTTLSVFFLWLLNSLKLVNNRHVDNIKKRGFFSFFMSFPFRSTVDLLAVLPDRIARDLNWSGATLLVTPDIFNVFDRVWLFFFSQNKAFGISRQIFDLVLYFFSH